MGTGLCYIYSEGFSRIEWTESKHAEPRVSQCSWRHADANRVSLSGNPARCIIQGHFVGQISHILDTSGQFNYQPRASSDLAGWIDLTLTLPETYAPTNEPRGRALWRTLIANQANGCAPAPEQSWVDCRKYLWWLLIRLMAKEVETGTAKSKEIYDKLRMLEILPSQQDTETVVDGYYHGDVDEEQLFKWFRRSFQLTYIERRLFRTSNGYLGLTGRSMKVDDAICVIAGAAVPFVLRKRVDGNYDMIGEAYVHGAMNGETVTEGSKWEKITLA